ncbi:hypothetical protein D9757_002109 [Collybiopsis confluens]|uniref:Ras modification protein ERF4 n=1 Tax=Collybiopsis confluens TaxID=2823264 RepID=A0A8H5HZJ0_9AGAR|nr:hypothetical protein D9757_002109 [Collybiopsis confluens]
MSSQEESQRLDRPDIIDITGGTARVSQPGGNSPPLTRSNSVSSVSEEDEKQPESRRDEWDPLQYQQESELGHGEDDDEEITGGRGDLMNEAGNSVVDINGRVIYPPSKPSRSNLHLEIEHKAPSPQPWDLVDPPLTNGEKLPNQYGTINSRRSNTTRSLIPKSSYYFGPPPPGAAFGSDPVGQIGLDHPREIIRVERDYTGGELIQFTPIYPLELEGRITPTQFLESMNSINELLISAHSFRRSILDNLLAVITLQLSTLLWSTHYDKVAYALFQYRRRLTTTHHLV